MVSSLPQGWHGIPVPTQNFSPASTSVSTAPTVIRKKWNSSLSTDVPRSKLPAYKPPSVRLRQSSVNSVLYTRSTTKSSNLQGNAVLHLADKEIQNGTTAATKELKNEITKLKKELNTMKTENSILKVKVRRVDDENIQKSKQIEKLRIELKALQKNKPVDSKKSKESELLLLRQKCLRLEGALKEKDFIIKKFSHELPLKPQLATLCTQSAKEITDMSSSKQDLTMDTKSAGKSSGRSNVLRANLSSKGEVLKLREMIHKLEKENQDLQQQVKEKVEEIKGLKLHLRSQTYIKPLETSASKLTSKANTNLSKSSTPPTNLQEKPRPGTTPSSKSVSSSTTSKTSLSRSTIRAMPKSRVNVQKKTDVKSTNKTVSRTNVQQHTIKKPVNKTNLKLSTIKAQIPKPQPERKEENNIEKRVQQMRENLAAKKIQRTWRNFRKQDIQEKEPEHIKKAISFIATSLKYHKMRKEKLSFAGTQKQIIPKLKDDDESAIVEAIRAATKKLWEN